MDHVLDIQVADDLSGWWWKDEDEFAWAVERGRCSASGAEAIRGHGKDAIARMEARARPFDGEWSALALDQGWPIPLFPAGCDQADVPTLDRAR